MSLSYFDYMREITKDELLKGFLAHGMFAEKIPPLLTSLQFYEYCATIQDETVFQIKEKRKWKYPNKDYIRYENMRNLNIPRPLAIPHPVAYRNLCVAIADCWSELQLYFKEKTDGQTYKISRIHIRKIASGDHLFEMSYKNIEKDPDPEIDITIGKRVFVEADISNCFHSIYTHSIPWAIVGKPQAKGSRDPNLWYNKLDTAIRDVKYAETHGICIGPHASSLISEIILVAVDKELSDMGYEFIRNIDDYSCYLENFEQAERFLRDLSVALKKYDLSLNHKKTKILTLPTASIESWVRRLKSFHFSTEKTEDNNEILIFKDLRSFLDLAIELMYENAENSAVINYAIKVISKKHLGKYAKEYYIKRVHSLVLLYPYLIWLLDEYLFQPFEVETKYIKKIADDLFAKGKKENLKETMSYALYFAIKYKFTLGYDKIYEIAEENRDCILLLLAFIYEKQQGHDTSRYVELAKSIQKDDFDRYWLFIYETLPSTQLTDNFFLKLKGEGISFVKSEYNA